MLLACIPAEAGDLKLFSLFGDHAILQRGKPVPVWGWAKPGEMVTVEFINQKVQATADAEGRWRVSLTAMEANSTPAALTVRTASGEFLAANDVLVGEVWFCSGQSNMAETVGTTVNAKEEVARGAQPLLREYRSPPRSVAEKPAADCAGQWKVANASTVKGFSGTAYYFGHALQEKLGVPVGLITSAVGATRIESWISRAAVAERPAMAKSLAALDKEYADYQTALMAFQAANPDPNTAVDPAAEPKAPYFGKNFRASLYNAQIAPHAGTAIRGFAWYQGEANRGDTDYLKKLTTLIESWRKDWNDPALPFFIVQIAPFDYKGAHRSPEIWEAQTRALTLPATAMVVTLDVGDLGNIHPPNKKPIGERLALQAMQKVYGKKEIVADSPLYASHTIANGKIAITFKNPGGGLVSRDGAALTWFTIAGADGIFTPAEAVISASDRVLVSSPQVPEPKSVRFAWSNIAQPNLMNKAGLPAGAFRQ